MFAWCTGVVRILAVAVLAAVAVAPAAAPSASAKEGVRPLLGIVWKAKKPQLARLDPATLAPLGSGVPVPGAVGTWSFSPDGGQVALASEAPIRIRVLDVGEMRQVAAMKLTGAGNVIELAWLRPDRLLVVHTRPDGARIVWIDPQARRVLKRAVLDVAPGPVAAAGDTVAALVPPEDGVGTARLVLASAGGSLREVALPAIPIGLWLPPTGGTFERVVPGLALDAAGRHAYVVGTNGVVAEVDVDSLAVTKYVLGRSLAKAMNGEELDARWLGNGMLAVAGASYSASLDAQGVETESSTPLGLRLIDVTTWAERTVDSGASGFTLASGDLLAYGSSWSSSAGVQKVAGMGLAAYGADGAQRYRLLAGQSVGMVQTDGARAYAWLDGPTPFHVAVVDLTSGSVEREVHLPPTALLADF